MFGRKTIGSITKSLVKMGDELEDLRGDNVNLMIAADEEIAHLQAAKEARAQENEHATKILLKLRDLLTTD